MSKLFIDFIIFVYNEESFIGLVLVDMLNEWVCEVIVCNNVSIDCIVEVVKEYGVMVVDELWFGYGSVCLAGMVYI